VSVVGIVPAAGSGERLGFGPKAFAPCGGRPLLEWSLEVLRTVCDRVVVAVPLGYEDPPDRVRGGPSRSASVRAALATAPEASRAVVHDAARPLLTREILLDCLAALDEGWDGAVAAAPVPDTIKEAGPDGRVIRTLVRSALWVVQTPQAFDAAWLRRALDVDEGALASATDDAGLVEAAGGRVRVVPAPPENLKVTGPLDLQLAELLLAARAATRRPSLT
jgi:2-C-methyl-D-erythritol 4-phosphate cytidylyltransferase